MNKTLILRNLIVTIILTAVTGGLSNFNVNAKEPQITPEVVADYIITYEKVDREAQLRKFFKKYNSPLEENSATFVEVADRYDMDYRLLPAISCLESSCGKKLIPESYNPFGWGVYGGNYIAFADYDESIETVGEGLHKGYIVKGANTVEKIAPIYNPPNPIKWGQSVRFFMNQIDNS